MYFDEGQKKYEFLTEKNANGSEYAYELREKNGKQLLSKYHVSYDNIPKLHLIEETDYEKLSSFVKYDFLTNILSINNDMISSSSELTPQELYRRSLNGTKKCFTSRWQSVLNYFKWNREWILPVTTIVLLYLLYFGYNIKKANLRYETLTALHRTERVFNSIKFPKLLYYRIFRLIRKQKGAG